MSKPVARPSSPRQPSRCSRAWLSRAAIVASAGLAASVLGGCEVDSWFDPSVVGRWENTPTVVPVLDRIDVIERDSGALVDVTPVMPEDLVPEPAEYRVAPGDALTVEILDFIEAGRPASYERVVDQRGYIDVPQLGQIYISKYTRVQIESAIREAIIAKGLLEDPLVTVQVPGQRQATFSVFGAVERTGRYAIPTPDYRLLQALTDAGGVSPTIPKVNIIRQVSLSEEATPPGGTPPKAPAGSPGTKPAGDGKSLIDLIDELTVPPSGGGAATPPAKPATSPPQAPSGAADSGAQPAAPAKEPQLEDLPDAAPKAPPPQNPSPGFTWMRQEGATTPEPSKAPPIDLVDTEPKSTAPAPLLPGGEVARTTPGRWVFMNGAWVQVIATESAGGGIPEGPNPLSGAKATQLVTQRVIEVPVAPLLQGVAQYNVIVRPGDVISVPPPAAGFVYVGGPGINRPGVYNLPGAGKLTLTRLVHSAGGFSQIAIPERVDLTRMVGPDRQAIIRLNARAIFEGFQPDIVMKADDSVNFGTNFWATPLAIIRGGFRMSYGFGFLLDRNFGNDVFGPPPEARNF